MPLLLKTVRTLRSLTLDDLADAVQVHRGTMQRIEAGRVDPSPELRKRIEDHFQIKWSVLNSSADDGLITDLLKFLEVRASL